LERGIFDPIKYAKYKILTSKAIQKRFFDAAKRKKTVYFDVNYIINDINVCENSINIVHQSPNVNVDVNVKEDVKKKKVFIPPTLDEIKNYIKEKKYNVDADKFFEYFTEGDWTDSGGKQVKNWKQKIITWHSHDNNGQVKKESLSSEEMANSTRDYEEKKKRKMENYLKRCKGN
jgi:hypothetical protein